MSAGNDSGPTINVNFIGNNNHLNVAGRDVNNGPVSREHKTWPGHTYRRLGKFAAGLLGAAATTFLSISGPNPPGSEPSVSPTVITAMCRDGSVSYSRTRSGTCSHHGGVARWNYDRSHPIWS